MRQDLSVHGLTRSKRNALALRSMCLAWGAPKKRRPSGLIQVKKLSLKCNRSD
jgi:hypothetical protein